MGLLGGLLELVSPTRCAGCDAPGALLCTSCRTAIGRIDPARACPRCGAPFGALVCTECWNAEFAFEAAVALGDLSGPLARCVVLHKDANERRLGAVLGDLVGEVVLERWDQWPEAVCWIPPTRQALARRGFDHGASIALPVADRVGCPGLALLARPRAGDQRTMDRAGRLASAAGSFRAAECVPSRVLVVDDVMTTGATLDAAASALLAAGAECVRIAVAARVW